MAAWGFFSRSRFSSCAIYLAVPASGSGVALMRSTSPYQAHICEKVSRDGMSVVIDMMPFMRTTPVVRTLGELVSYLTDLGLDWRS